MHDKSPAQAGMRDASNVLAPIHCGLCFMEYSTGANTPPWGVMNFSGTTFPDISVYREDHIGSIKSCRTRQHILNDSVRDFLLTIPIHQQSIIVQAGKQSACKPGTFRLLSTAVPFSTFLPSGTSSQQSTRLVAKISGPLLRQQLPDIDNYPNLVLAMLPGIGQVMKSLFETALAEGNSLSAHQARDFSKTLVQVIVHAVRDAPSGEMQKACVNQSSHSRIREAAYDFISRNLANPELDCALVAEHCQVSETYLHTAFVSTAVKVGAYIRETRLQNCRSDIRNPALRYHSITEIMMNWGFTDPTSFGRIYKTRFGVSPRADRSMLA